MLDARLGAGTYTDDTQMTAALAEALLEAEAPCRPDLDVIAPRSGARLQAAGVLSGLRDGRDGDVPSPARLVDRASERWDEDGGVPNSFRRRMEWIAGHLDATTDEAAAEIGAGSRGSDGEPLLISFPAPGSPDSDASSSRRGSRSSG